jgi:hypothetical protein
VHSVCSDALRDWGSLGKFREVFIGEGLRRILTLRLERCDARQKWPFGVKERRVVNTLPDVVSCCSGVSGCIPMRLEARGNLGRLGEILESV